MRFDPAKMHTSCKSLSGTELVTLAQRGNQKAVRALVQRNNQQLFRIARGILNNDTDAEDAVQSAYVAAVYQTGDVPR